MDKHYAVLDATWEDQIRLNADHQNMCKLASREDVSYQVFLASTTRILEAQANKNKDARGYYYHKRQGLADAKYQTNTQLEINSIRSPSTRCRVYWSGRSWRKGRGTLSAFKDSKRKR